MADRLPVVTSKQLARALERAGFERIRQTGSHAIFKRGARFANVPMHGGDVPTGTLRAVLKATGLTADELREHL